MPADHTPTDETVLRQPAAPISPQEIAEMRARAADNRYDGFPQSVALRLLDAIERLSAENARLTSERDKLLRDRVNGYVVEDGVVNYLVIREALSKLSGVPAMSDVTMRHVEIIGEKMAALKTEVARLKGRMEAACGLIERGAVRAWNDCHYRTEPLSEDRKRVIETHDMFRQAMDLLGNSEDVAHAAAKADRLWNSPMEDVIAAIRATIAESSEAAGLRPLSPEGGGYLLTRAKAGGIDMDLLGKLCREEPDEATKREVAEMMDGLTGRIGAQP